MSVQIAKITYTRQDPMRQFQFERVDIEAAVEWPGHDEIGTDLDQTIGALKEIRAQVEIALNTPPAQLARELKETLDAEMHAATMETHGEPPPGGLSDDDELPF
jgi:DNA-binding transcriptional ArsR family regulator